MQSQGELEEATTQEKEYLDFLRKIQADFINYRHRVEREREEQAKFTQADLFLKLLPVLDDLNSVHATMPVEVAHTDWAWGIELIQRKLRAILEQESINKIAAFCA